MACASAALSIDGGQRDQTARPVTVAIRTPLRVALPPNASWLLERERTVVMSGDGARSRRTFVYDVLTYSADDCSDCTDSMVCGSRCWK
jgi:hypothetical protein